jgi:UvrD/REP helicase N-terminal domain
MLEPEIDLLAVERGSITSPAGCGKTQLIANALARHTGPKPILVLTHTNAGVGALRARLDKAGVPHARYRVATLDGFAIRVIRTFPKRSGHDPAILELANPRNDYPAIRDAAVAVVEAGHLKEILPSTYARLFVDEYQDCSLVQHALTVAAAKVLPTCVLGDPMQAIFGFNGLLVDWNDDVHAAFRPCGELATPWRWINAGERAFGQWLLMIRKQLLLGSTIDLAAAPENVTLVLLDGEDDYETRLRACRSMAPTEDGCVLILADATKPKQQRRFASQTPGAVVAENVDMRDLVDFAEALDLDDRDVLGTVVNFASSVMINVGGDDLLARVESLKSGRTRRAPSETEKAALEFSQAPSYAGAGNLLAAISRDAGVRTHRPPVLRGCHKMLQLCAVEEGPTAYEAAVQVREQARVIGRPLAKRTVGSTLLLKGLEADVAVILNPELMDRQHLYVAMTRGARKLVICSDSHTLHPEP